MSSPVSNRAVVALTALAVIIILLAPATLHAQVEIELSVAHVGGIPGQQDLVMEMYLKNHLDSIAAFEVWLQMDRPNMTEFQLNLDTTGCLVSGWELVEANSLVGNYYDLKIVGAANYLLYDTIPSIPPQTGEMPLVKLHVSILEELDPFGGLQVQVFAMPFLDHFNFSDELGNALGISYYPIVDTNFFLCTSWLPPEDTICLNWVQVALPPYDSIEVFTDSVPYFDTSKVVLNDGSITIIPGVCGDIHESWDAFCDISDLTRMIDFLFISYQPLLIDKYGNVDASQDGVVDISDITQMIGYLFTQSATLDCPE